MILVCNTGPLIALAKVGKLGLLLELGYERVLIPPMVQKELRAKFGPEAEDIESAASAVSLSGASVRISQGRTIASTGCSSPREGRMPPSILLS